MPHASDEEPTTTGGPRGETLLGRFRVEKNLGHGGMGEVLLAYDTLLDRRVALKRLLAAESDPGDARASMLKEARRASQIADRHVAAIHDVLDLGDQVLLVMEHVDGATLRRRMSGPMSRAAFLDLGLQCAEGVAAAHACGVIHRDIKPENFMVTREGEVKILDFGIARRAPSAEGFASTSTEGDSSRGAGTLPYMSPEAHVGGSVDERSDVFALGVVFYEMLTGRRPFAGPTYGALLEQMLNTEPPPVLSLNAEAGLDLSAVVARMLARQAGDRFANATEVVASLKGAIAGEPLVAVATKPARAAARLPHADLGLKPAARFVVGVLVALAGIVGVELVAFPALPRDMNVALLPPVIAVGSDADAFAIGCIALVNARLRRHADTSGFQMTSYSDAFSEKVRSPDDARRILGANLAIVTAVTQGPDLLRARLDLMDTARARRIATRTVQVSAAEPFALLDGTYRAAEAMLRLAARTADSTTDWGIRGAGTLRFCLQGLGRLQLAGSADDSRRAVTDFEVACRTDPQGAVARAGLASSELRTYIATTDTTWLARARDSAREAVRLGPGRPESHRALAAVFMAEKRYSEAAEECELDIHLDPTDHDMNLKLARVYAHLGEPERERTVYLQIIERLPHAWQPWWWLGTWYFRRGDVAASVQAYREMIRRAPQLYRGYANLGGLLVLRGEYASAIDTLRHSLALRPAQDAYANLGTACFNSGRLEDAVSAYNQSFQFGEPDYASWLNLGDAYFYLGGRRDDALTAYAQSIRVGREAIRQAATKGQMADVQIPANMAVLFARLAQPDSARLYLDFAVRSDSANSGVGYCAALTCWQLGERGRAMEWLARSVRQGYPKVWLRDSPVFREWRGLPEFRALVGTAEPRPQQAAARS
jgi:tetratricopeptide (TPR) repeat protein